MLHSLKCKVTERRCATAGFTLVEVTSALVLTALFAAVASRNFQIGSVGAVRHEVEVQSLVMELQLARQDAILSGESRGLQFGRQGRQIVSVQSFAADLSGQKRLLGQARKFHADLTRVSVDRSSVEFSSEGHATGASQITLQTQHRQWDIAIVPLTGAVRVTEILK